MIAGRILFPKSFNRCHKSLELPRHPDSYFAAFLSNTEMYRKGRDNVPTGCQLLRFTYVNFTSLPPLIQCKLSSFQVFLVQVRVQRL